MMWKIIRRKAKSSITKLIASAKRHGGKGNFVQIDLTMSEFFLHLV